MGAATLNTTYFGELRLDDNEAILMDGGISGIQGHTLEIGSTPTAHWERRVDSVRPHGKAGAGVLVLTEQERRWLDAVLVEAASLALAGRTNFFGSGPTPVPRWVWLVALARPSGPLLLQGAGTAPSSAPAELAPLLQWLVERVDRAAESQL